MAAHHVQLGTIHLDLTSGPSDPTDTAPWTDLTADHLSALDISPEHIKLNSSLAILLRDPGIGCVAQKQRTEAGLRVRLSLLPSDAPGSAWRRQSAKVQKARAGALRVVYESLKQGWDGEGEWVMGRTTEDEMKIGDLYTALPSPSPPTFQLSIRDGLTKSEKEVRMGLNGYWEPDGIQTAMYKYQFRSVSRMLQMETSPGRMIDPQYIPLEESGRAGTYYLDTREWDVQRHPGWYDLPKGGILCEQMGVGKTLMCLALIVATLSTPTRPPVGAYNASQAMSEESLRTFPFSSHAHARERLEISREGTGVPPLTRLCLNKLKRTDAFAGRVGGGDTTRDDTGVATAVPPAFAQDCRRPMFYYTYPQDPTCPRGVKENRKQKPTKMFLANTTLVVVPQILMEQWKAEIQKHVQVGWVRVLDIGAKEEVPSVEAMLEFDVILVDVVRFGQEETLRRLDAFKDPSEFTKARWKRIILDEGHVAGSVTSNAMRLAISLSVERRWIVSGTPTKHLQQGGELEVASTITSPASAPAKHLVWSKRDVEDATRIGVMVGGFLAAEPFRSEDTFNEKITRLLRGSKGPAFGAVRRLRYLMGVTMVKHAPQVIDAEACLPPSTVSVEMLQFHPMQRITYNVLAALIASNVYTSNFEDPDYFLHPRNASAFHQVIRNLHLACFWYSAHEMGARESLERTQKHLAKNTSLVPAGRVVLEEAVRHLETALATPGWEEWMRNGVSIACEADSLPEMVKSAWSDSAGGMPGLVDAHSLAMLRDLNAPGRGMEELEKEGTMARMIKAEGMRAEETKGKGNGNGNGSKRKREGHAGVEGANGESEGADGDFEMLEVVDTKSSKTAAQKPVLAGAFAKSPKKGSRSTSKRFKADSLDSRLDEAARNALAASVHARENPLVTPPRADGPRPMPTTLVTRSRSTKVNFVLRSVLGSAPEDKFVIFGDVYELGHMSEGLDLIDIKSCFAGSSVTGAMRAQAVKDFEKPETKVFLLELKIGARGLNLVAANRMIFLSPVWNLDVQAQAIKRVHRIGQTKPTKVEILVTRGTFEEDIAERSSSSRSEKEEQLYSRAMIENPSFVYTESEGDYSFDIRFIPKPPPAAPTTAVQGEAGSVATPIPTQTDESPSPALITPSTPISARPPFADGQATRRGVKCGLEDEAVRSAGGDIVDGSDSDGMTVEKGSRVNASAPGSFKAAEAVPKKKRAKVAFV